MWIPLPEIVPENPEYSVVEQPVLNPVHSSDKPVEHSVEQRLKSVDAGEAYSGSSVAMAINSLFASVVAGSFVLIGARKARNNASKHARKN